MGSLTMLVSSIITGGIGPWLPSQMFAAGWVGLSAALLPMMVNRLKSDQQKPLLKQRLSSEIIILVIFGFIWGVLYGFIMNLWSWPYFSGPAEQYWAPGAGIGDTIQRYVSYYILTSLVWDLGRGIGSAVILFAFGAAVIRALHRFRSRFTFDIQSRQPNEPEVESDTMNEPPLPIGGEL